MEFNRGDREMWNRTVFNSYRLLNLLYERVTQTGAEDNSNFRIYYALTFKKVSCFLYLIKHENIGTTNKIGIDRVKRKILFQETSVQTK